MIKRFKNTVPWTYVTDDLNGEDIVGTFYEKKLQERNEKDFRIKKVIKRKATHYLLNGKSIVIHLIAG